MPRRESRQRALPGGRPPEGYYRFPTLRAGTIVFTAEGGLWCVPLSGGVARRLTRFPGRQGFAQLSPDGSTVAFTAAYQGSEDVWIMPVAGGEPRRLTQHPFSDQVIGWTVDGRSVLFRSTRDSPFSEPQGYRVCLDDGSVTPLGLGPVARLAYSPDGRSLALGRFVLETHHWKRYLGGMAQEIWVGDARGTRFERITTYQGMNAFPMWHGSRIFFLSDRDGIPNIYSADRSGNGLRQHTHQGRLACRWPSLGERHIVYTVGADLWTLDLGTDREEKLAVTIATDMSGRQPRHVPATTYLTDFDVAPDGRRVLVGSRGQVSVLPVKQGRTIVHRKAGVRYRHPRYSPEGTWIGAFSDESGEEEFVMLPVTTDRPARRFPASRGGHHRAPVFSPDGKKVAYGDQTLALWVLDTGTGRVTMVDRSEAAEITDAAWSADGRWLAYSLPLPNACRSLKLHDTRANRSTSISQGMTDDHSPCFDRDGQYLFFLSQRHLDPLVGEIDFEAIVERTARIYAVTLRKGGRPLLFPRQPEDEASDEALAAGKNAKKTAGAAPGPVRVDPDDLGSRIDELPVAPALLANLRSASGRLFYVTRPHKGLLGRDFWSPEQEPAWTLKSFDLKRRKEETWAGNIHGFDVTPDGKKLVLRGRDFLRVVGSDQKPRGEEEEKDKDDGEKGIVRLKSLQLRVDPAREWSQMLTEAWRLQRDFFFDPGMGGVQWRQVLAEYGRLLARISTREELTDLIGEMISELATSHTYVFQGDTGDPRGQPGGTLGADFAGSTGPGATVARVLRGRDWSERTRSPLSPPHVAIRKGTRIVAVDGETVVGPEALFGLLSGKAGQEVLLTVVDPGRRTGPRNVIVRCLRPAEEVELRYLDWVEGNRSFVHRQTGGAVGYLHLPDMGGRGLSEFHRAFFPQIKKKGLIVDIRNNAGGFISQLIVARLARRLWAFMQPRRGLVLTYPHRVFHAPFVVLTNHAAGSDGDIFAESIQLLKLAPVVGSRSWGGVVGLAEVFRLADNGIVTVPGVAWWDPRRGWSLEGSGVTPDLEARNTPTDYHNNVDAQLVAALAAVKRRIEEEPWSWPSPPPFVDKSLPGFRCRRHSGDHA
ncbi:MAG: PD40 domain-containing protein [Candidatus Riflebacteria bacterium]|nr:PD40 domain-containing protein [Candidatus Riflebacteria bacterium]